MGAERPQACRRPSTETAVDLSDLGVEEADGDGLREIAAAVVKLDLDRA